MAIIIIYILGMFQWACEGNSKAAFSTYTSLDSTESLYNKNAESDEVYKIPPSSKSDTVSEITKENNLVISKKEDRVEVPGKRIEEFDSKSNFDTNHDENNSIRDFQEAATESSDPVLYESQIQHEEESLKEIFGVSARINNDSYYEIKETEQTGPSDHSKWHSLLDKYVDGQGRVNYLALKKEESSLDEYLKLLEGNPPAETWSNQAKLAYWINAYNAFTVKLILKNYPLKSIMDINNGKAWDLKWINIGGRTLSLNQIENEIIRPQFKEPRIHFAVNCAAKSCPPLANIAYTAENLEVLLEKQTLSFINNRQYNQISEKSASISRIFEWYKEDFERITDFLNQYATVKLKTGAKITFNEYDWGLNN